MDERFTVKRFVGTQPITSLPVYPLKYHPDKDALLESLIAQGKRWEEHKGYHYRQYEGITLGSSQHGSEVKQYHVKNRIIINAEAFDIFCSYTSAALYDDKDMPEELTDDLRMITSNMVCGYPLNDKEWLLFYLHGSSKIEFNTDAFESLVLPPEEEGLKYLLLAITKAQSKKLDAFDDVVRGKGPGIVVQLSRTPGVGKTLTAESVAEAMQVPLYTMSAVDLGSHAEDVESHLKDILRMVLKWGTVLLLDEADVFLETHSSTDLERNELNLRYSNAR